MPYVYSRGMLHKLRHFLSKRTWKVEHVAGKLMLRGFRHKKLKKACPHAIFSSATNPPLNTCVSVFVIFYTRTRIRGKRVHFWEMPVFITTKSLQKGSGQPTDQSRLWTNVTWHHLHNSLRDSLYPPFSVFREKKKQREQQNVARNVVVRRPTNHVSERISCDIICIIIRLILAS